MMEDLAFARCFNHERREAVARCPECGRCFCRECITEHEHRVICAACLRKLTGRSPGERIHAGRIFRLALGVLGIVTAWLFFFSLGKLLLLIPSNFHEGTVWESLPW
jgi:hypothetical protein